MRGPHGGCGKLWLCGSIRCTVSSFSFPLLQCDMLHSSTHGTLPISWNSTVFAITPIHSSTPALSDFLIARLVT